MTRTTLTLLAASLLTTACNEHPLKDSEMGHGGIEFGEDADGGTDGEEQGETDGESADESGGNSFPDTGDGNDSDGGTPNCGSDLIELSAAPPNVMLVLDKSGSMTNPDNDWDHDGNPATDELSRWASLYDVVDDLLGQYDNSMNFGAVLFPAADAEGGNGAERACSMRNEAEVAIASSNGANILGAIPGRDADTDGGTPARFGVLNAVDHLTDVQAEGPRAMVLVTDGEANCIPGVEDFWNRYDEELETAVGSAYADNGIPTYVVGIDIDDRGLSGDDPRSLQEAMNDVADAGGVARDGAERFYNVADHDALQAALDEIAQRVECTVSLSEVPADPEYVELTINGQTYEQVASCADGDGWRFTTDTAPFNSIELCGNACGAFVDAGAVQTEYMCPPAG